MKNQQNNAETLCELNAPDTAGEDLIDRFERGLTSADSFHHADHVRLAFEYLSRYPALTALEKFSSALRRYAVAKGKANLYHETVTWAYLLLIHERMARDGQGYCWAEFSARNLDLFQWKGGILDRLYSKQTLDSPVARSVFVLPDRGL